MNELKDINKVIFNKEVYYRVNDLTGIFEVSLFKIKKTILKMELETAKLKGFGNGLFIKEKDVNKIVINEKSVMLSTKVKVLNEELKMTKLLNKIFQPGEEVEKELINDSINKFIEIEDYEIEKIEEPELTKEDAEFNKEMEDKNLAYRKVHVGLKTMYGLSGVNVLIDKDSNIIGTPYYNYFEVKDDKFYIDWNEKCSENIECNYDIVVPLNMGTVEVDEDKVCKELMRIAYSRDFDDDDFGRIYKNNIRLYNEEISILQHKDTMFTKIIYK